MAASFNIIMELLKNLHLFENCISLDVAACIR